MGHVAIVADSAANLPAELVSQYDIHIIPLILSWQDESLREGIDISPEQVYLRQQAESYSPVSDAADPPIVLELLRTVNQEVDTAVVIVHSLRLSRSLQTARLAQQMDPPFPIQVVDAGSADMAQGFVALESARVASAGASALETVTFAKTMADRVRLMAILDSSDYLHRTGQIGRASTRLGNLLRLKPIVALPPRGGRLVVLARPRTWQRALDHLLDLVIEQVGHRPLHAAVSHNSRPAEAAYLAGGLERKVDLREIYLGHVTPLLGVAAGPMVALSFWAEETGGRRRPTDLTRGA